MKFNVRDRPRKQYVHEENCECGWCTHEKYWVGLEQELRQRLDAQRIQLWLANTEHMSLFLRVEAILGLYRKEVLGE